MVIEIIKTTGIRLGLPMWHMPDWRGGLLLSDCRPGEALSQYSQCFSAVEGNTTFYGIPDDRTIRGWMNSTGQEFRFIFKVPKAISHGDSLGSPEKLPEWERLLSLCHISADKLGPLFLQLPPFFDASCLAQLEAFLAKIPEGVRCSVEVRNDCFFRKDDVEVSLNRLLIDHEADRVMFDTRGLFRDESRSPAVLDARQKKPDFPLHVISTGHSPIIRFLGHHDPVQNTEYWAQWHNKLQEWLDEGKEPYFFMHTAGNQEVPEVTRKFLAQGSADAFIFNDEYPGEAERAAQPQLF